MSALLKLTFSDPFAEVAALHHGWPHIQSDQHRETLIARARWAASYWDAASFLYASRNVTDHIMFAGPVMQNTGLACELVLKCLLFGDGHSEEDLRKLGHSLSAIYDEAVKNLDIHRFLDAVVRASKPLGLPNEVAVQFAQSGRTHDEAEVAWRVFSQHVRILDKSYCHPYRARYVSQGPIVLPEPFILLLGSAILLNAMNERLNLQLVGVARGQSSDPENG